MSKPEAADHKGALKQAIPTARKCKRSKTAMCFM